MTPIDWADTRSLALAACYTKGLRDHDAEDVAQDVAVKILRAGYEDISKWLIYEMAKQIMRDLWAKHRAKPFADYETPPEAETPAVPWEEWWDVQAAMPRLTAAERQAVARAARGETPGNAGRQMLWRARRKLAAA